MTVLSVALVAVGSAVLVFNATCIALIATAAVLDARDRHHFRRQARAEISALQNGSASEAQPRQTTGS